MQETTGIREATFVKKEDLVGPTDETPGSGVRTVI